MKLTKRNHSNPCAWTAFWNVQFFNARMSPSRKSLHARKQAVYSLNLSANRVLRTTVDNVHYENDIGIAEITPDDMKSFCKRRFPEKYKQFAEDMKDHPETLRFDLEQILNTIENTPAYEALYSAITEQRIQNREQIAYLSCFVVFQHLRSHLILKAALERWETAGMKRFEYFWLLHRLLGNRDWLYELASPLATSQWIIYRPPEHALPLPDTPVLVKPGSNIMVALSPRMLVEIVLKVQRPEGAWLEKSNIPKNKLREYRRRAILSTFKEVIFNDPEVLEEWRLTPEFKRQIRLVDEAASYNELLAQTEAGWFLESSKFKQE